MAEDDKKPAEDKSDEDREKEEAGDKADDSDPADDADDRDDEGDDEEDEEGDDQAEEAAPAPAPAKGVDKKVTSTPAPAKAVDKPADKPAKAKPVVEGHASSPRKRAPLPPEPPPAAVGKTVTIFLLTMGALSAGFYFLGAETGGDRTAPRWKTGQTVDVNITLVANDRNELACASDVEIAGRHCEFVNKTKPAEKVDDDKLLKPYTTTDNVQFLGAGLWTQPDLDVKKLPADRFTVKCKYTVEGEIKKPGVRWASRGGFSDKENNWYAGVLKECSLAP